MTNFSRRPIRLLRSRGLVTMAAVTIPLILVGLASSRVATAATEFFSTRAAFNAAAGGLPVETFSAANLFGQPQAVVSSPLSSATNNGVFAAGSILPGLAIGSSSANTPGLIVYGDGALAGGTKSVGTNWFGDKLVLTFAPGVTAVGTDVFAATSPGQTLAGSFTMSAYNGTTLLGTTTVMEAKGAFGFAGVTSTTAITSVALLYLTDDATTFADNIAFGTAAAGTPAIAAQGVVPIYSASNTIQPGSWVSIYGSRLAAAAAVWNGDFPTTLGGTSVTINGKAAYLWYVSPAQINLQAPDDTFTGNAEVVVKTAAGSASSTVTLGPFGPSLSVSDGKHAAGVILRPNGSGTAGGGAYDILGQNGVAARAGDTVVFFGVGFGPTNPAVPAGAAFSGSAACTNAVRFSLGDTTVLPSFAGIASAGLYQFNLVIPAGLGAGDVPVRATVGGVQTPAGALITLQ